MRRFLVICQKRKRCGIVSFVFMRRKLLLFTAPPLLALFVFILTIFLLNRNAGKGALQVTAQPKSKVYLNNKLIGQTPLCKCEGPDMIEAGEYTIKLSPEGDLSAFEEKITITKSALTVVDRTFGKGALSEGSTITLTKLDNTKELALSAFSFPHGVDVFVDNTFSGKTPLSIKTLTASDHTIRFERSGYREKTVRIRAVLGYKLTVLATLGIMPSLTEEEASPSAQLIASPSATPVPLQVVILNTPTGFLRVRESGSLASSEIARVVPGEIFDFVKEQEGWFAIRLKDGRVGWVSSQYARKQ